VNNDSKPLPSTTFRYLSPLPDTGIVFDYKNLHQSTNYLRGVVKMKRVMNSKNLCVLFIIIFGLFTLSSAQSLPDSVNYNTADIDIGEPFYTGYFTGFGHSTINSFIEDPVDGYLHVAYVDNYELYYYKSTDEGQSWIKEQIITGHEGDIRYAALAIDLNQKIFIAFTIHSLYNYSNPTGISFGQEFFYDLYCLNNLSGNWSIEQIELHSISNYGAVIQNIFVDKDNDVHILANRYGWNSLGGEAWEWIRNSTTNAWGPKNTIVQFSDAGYDKFIFDRYLTLIDTAGTINLVCARQLADNYRLFYLTYDGSSWGAPVEISDNIAVAWNRFDAIVDPDYNKYVVYLYNNSSGLPELKVTINLDSPQTANINLAPTDTLNYFTLHCDQHGLFTMYLWIKNKNVHITFSNDCLNWSDPVEVPDSLTNYFGGMMVRTDTRQGYFTNRARQIVVAAGTRGAQPYGPDSLFYGDVTYYTMPAAPELYSPANGSVIDTTSVEFNWSESYPAIDNYWFEIADNDLFNNSFIDSSLTNPTIIYDNILPNKTYYWRTKCKNLRGWGEYSETWNFSTVIVSVEDNKFAPSDFILEQNFPNPFNPSTQISFNLPERAFVDLKIYNILGIEVANLISKELEAGHYTKEFDASSLSSGIYLYKLYAGKFLDVKKMTFIK